MRRFERERRAPAHYRAPCIRLAAWVALLALGAPMPAPAWGGKVKLKRRYHSGQTMVYASKMHTKVEIHSNPPGLARLLPPMPTDFTLQQQNTMTVKTVHDDGSADVENRFDKFEFQSNFADRLPENLRDPAVEAQQEISSNIAGQNLVAHYDRKGQLLRFEGGEGLFEQFDVAHRETLRQVVGFFLQQMEGDALFPDHPVKPGETWKHKLDAQPNAMDLNNAGSENTLRYIGKTKVGGVKAAIVEFSFLNTLTPSLNDQRKTGPLALLESQGMGMDVHINGQGKGRVLVALDDGRILQNHASVRQTMSATLKSPASGAAKDAQTLKFEIQSDTDMDIDGSSR